MTCTREQVLTALSMAPAGLTTAQLGEKLNSTGYNVSGVVSKLYLYGKINRERVMGRRQLTYRYKAKP